MRLIVGIKLRDNTLMNVIANTQNKESARDMAVKLSPRLFADKRFHIYYNNPIVNVEKWSQDKHVVCQCGYRKYAVAFILNGGVQFLQIQAAGVKSAYNNVKLKYGIQENLFMMIYETNQFTKQKSAMELAKSVLGDEDKLKEVIRFALDKICEESELIPYSSEIKLLIAIVTDFRSGEYQEISSLAIIGIVAVLLYIVNPSSMILDIVPGMPAMSEVGLVIWLLKQLANDIDKYTKWITSGDEDIIIV